jgi:predicted PurR-regulated permease PerM
VLVSVGTAITVGAFSAADHLHDIRWEIAGEHSLDEKNTADRETLERMSKARDPALKHDSDGRNFVDEDMSGDRKLGLIERITANLTPRLRRIPSGWISSIAHALETQAGEALSFGVEASKGLRTFLSQLGNFFGYVFLVPIYTFFLLLSLTDIQRVVSVHLPGLYRERVLAVARKLDGTLAAFFRGRLLLALGKGLVTWFGLWLVGVRFSFFVGMLAGALSVVPFLGVLVGGLLACAFAYEPGLWATRCGGAALVFLAAEALETALFPYLIGKNTGLHPLTLILSIFCCGKIFGLFGVLLAVPIACTVKILFLEFVLPEIQALAREGQGS